MPHPLILGLFGDSIAAAAAARAVHALGIDAADLSVVARSHQDEVAIAEDAGGTPGVEIEDSRPAARLGELSGLILAVLANVMPGTGSLVTAGPLAAELGEAAGHAARSVSSMLTKAGLPSAHAAGWQSRIEAGAVLLGVHLRSANLEAVEAALQRNGAEQTVCATWDDEQ